MIKKIERFSLPIGHPVESARFRLQIIDMVREPRPEYSVPLLLILLSAVVSSIAAMPVTVLALLGSVPWAILFFPCAILLVALFALWASPVFTRSQYRPENHNWFDPLWEDYLRLTGRFDLFRDGRVDAFRNVLKSIDEWNEEVISLNRRIEEVNAGFGPASSILPLVREREIQRKKLESLAHDWEVIFEKSGPLGEPLGEGHPDERVKEMLKLSDSIEEQEESAKELILRTAAKKEVSKLG
jgi:hypothetical protein